MGSGGPRGLQNRCDGAFALLGGFDSLALPPTHSSGLEVEMRWEYRRILVDGGSVEVARDKLKGEPLPLDAVLVELGHQEWELATTHPISPAAAGNYDCWWIFKRAVA